MAVQPGEVALYADETRVELEPLLDGVGEYRYKDITRIEYAFLCPQCDSEQFIESTPPLGPDQSYPCATCDHVIEITPEWEDAPAENNTSAKPGLARRTLTRILPFGKRISSSGSTDEPVTPPKYHIDHVLEFVYDMALRREVRLLGERNPSELLGIMMRLRTTERVRFGSAVATLVLLFAAGVWLFPGVSLNLLVMMVLLFLGGSVIYLFTESPLIPYAALSRLRDEYNIPDAITGSLFIRYADYYRYGQQLALSNTDPDPVDRTPVRGVEYASDRFAEQPPERASERQD